MARPIVKTLTITCVAFKTVSVEDGIPSFVDQPDAVFSGQLDKDKVERQLKARLGKDTMIVITNIDAGQHRYEMSMEEFVLNAHIADGEGEPDDADNDDAQAAEQDEDVSDRSPEIPAEETPADIPDSEPAAEAVKESVSESVTEAVPEPAAETAEQPMQENPPADEPNSSEDDDEILPF